MDGTALRRHSIDRAQELPGTELTHPFGEEWDVFKVRGKVFMLQAIHLGQQTVTLKATPADSEALQLGYPDILPGYHMNKRHWITLYPGGELDEGLLRDLVTDSYLLVLERNVPKSQWPVDPATFGRPS